MNRIKLFILLTLCTSTLAACETMDKISSDIKDIDLGLPALSSTPSGAERFITNSNCPQVEIIEELSALHEFKKPSKPSQETRISSVTLINIESRCSYSAKSVTVDLKLAFEGNLGPKAKQRASDTPFFSYPFFIAVTSPGGDILAKEVFAASMTYKPDQTQHAYYESLRQMIPIGNRARGKRYKVLIGLQLSQDQLDYNRKLMAPKPVPETKPEAPKPQEPQEQLQQKVQ